MTIEAVWTPETQQQVFRRLLTATARPGTVLDLSDLLQAEPAWKAVLATLVDGMVLLSDPYQLLDEHTWQFMQAISGPPERAAYIIAEGNRGPGFEPARGTLESPESGATLLLTVTQLGGGHGKGFTCSGPGIEKTTDLVVDGLDPQWLEQRSSWNAYFPLGVDFLLADPTRIAALPRTTLISSVHPEEGV